MFDFQIDNNVSLVNTSKPRLAPWEIHKVKLASVKNEEITGKADPSQKYKLIRVRFENDEGYYEESIFYPTEADSERKQYEAKDGHKYERPSNWERTKYFIYLTLQVLNPEGLKKFQVASAKFKNFDMMAAAYVKLMNEVIGAETEIKLGGRRQQNGNVIPAIPSFVSLTHDGQLFISSYFIGDRLFYSAYEEGQRTAFKQAKPTNMPDLTAMPNLASSDIPTTESEKDNSMKVDDLADLLADLQ